MPALAPSAAIGRAVALALLVAAIPAACNRQPEGAVKVAAIGRPPRLTDPATGPLSPPDAVLLANAAQGLVRFDARGQVEPGLAERWNVSDDGLSYIFRLASDDWPDGTKITARQVAILLRRELSASSNNPLKDTLGAIDEIVPMTDRVLEIRLKSPRPNLLQLLAQPEFALVREGQGSGPFQISDSRGPGGELRLRREVPSPDGEDQRREDVWLSGADAPAAVRRFAAGDLDIVMGGTFADLPVARSVKLPRRALAFDPVAGLFGLVPARIRGPLADPELRRLLAQAIDRDALVDSLNVPGLGGRATILEAGLDGIPDPVQPTWLSTPIGERRPELIAAAERLKKGDQPQVIRIALTDGPGADILLNRLRQDWALLGWQVDRAEKGQPADLKLVDAVAPSTSPAWFLRQFRCGAAPICDPEIDPLLEAARTAPVVAQRNALLAEAARRMDDAQLFLPVAAPVRWTLVSRRISGFAGNRFARHTLTGLEQKLDEGAQ
jgi:oligopeptide transport system substrate-binding protein